MNLERWIKHRRASWQSLEELLAEIDKRGMGSLDKYKLRQLGKLYRAISADLSRARAFHVDQQLEVYINNLAVRAHNQVYQKPKNRLVDLIHFLWFGFPQLVRQKIGYILVSILFFLFALTASYLATNQDINFAHLEVTQGHPLVPEDLWSIIERKQMWTNAMQGLGPLEASRIATNNIRVAILGFALGITFGFGTILVLLINGMEIGTVFGVCKSYGLDSQLMAFIAPHGVLELAAIFISAGAGLLMGKALTFPGNYKRIDALKLAARPAFTMFAGCVPLLLVAGCIEGFISPRTDLPTSIKYWLSAITLILLLFYLFVPRKPLIK